MRLDFPLTAIYNSGMNKPLTIDEVAAIYGVSPEAVRNLPPTTYEVVAAESQQAAEKLLAEIRAKHEEA